MGFISQFAGKAFPGQDEGIRQWRAVSSFGVISSRGKQSLFDCPTKSKSVINHVDIFKAKLFCPFAESLSFPVDCGSHGVFVSPPSWRSERVVNGPFASESCLNHSKGQMQFFTPVDKRFGYSFVGNFISPSLISLLGFSIGPSTVFRKVSKLIVDAIKRKVFVWFGSKISKEVPETIKPLMADQNTSPPVIRPSGVFSIVAAVLHIPPCSKFRFEFFGYPTDGWSKGHNILPGKRFLNKYIVRESNSFVKIGVN